MRRFGTNGIAHRRRAFSYFEVLIAVAIIAVLSATAILRYGAYASRRRLDVAAARVVTDLAHAQAAARRRAMAIAVEFRPTLRKYAIPALASLDRSTSAYVVDLGAEPYGVELRSADFSGDTNVTFNGYGLPSSGGTVVLRQGSSNVAISVDGDTGIARIE